MGAEINTHWISFLTSTLRLGDLSKTNAGTMSAGNENNAVCLVPSSKANASVDIPSFQGRFSVQPRYPKINADKKKKAVRRSVSATPICTPIVGIISQIPAIAKDTPFFAFSSFPRPNIPAALAIAAIHWSSPMKLTRSERTMLRSNGIWAFIG
ncbi:MAG: Uncharacterised protein [Acidimicrobiales bacterium AG-410-I20]|nr:MAG: Uncharacterised protein [Acidimicrobiales bacterium AG-410-I20]